MKVRTINLDKSEIRMQDKMNFMINQYTNSQVDYGEVKQGVAQDDILSVKTVNSAEIEANKEYEKFKERLKVFDGVTSISKAKELAKSFLPTDRDKAYIKVGSGLCLFISRADTFRVCLENGKEFICYNIVKNN